MNPRSLPLLAALLLLTVARTTEAKSPQKTLLSLRPNGPRIDLLSGRFSIAMPLGAYDRPRAREGASASTLETAESWIELEVGKAGLMLGARELFALSSGDLSRDLESLSTVIGNFEPMKREPLALGPGLTGIALSSTHTQYDEEFVLAVLAAREDRSLVLLSFGVRSPGTKKMAPVVEWTRAMAKTLRLGERRLESGAGTRVLPLERLAVDVPEGFVLTGNALGDTHARLYQLRRLVDFGNKAEGCGLYVGPDPAPISRPQEDDPEKPVPFRGKLFGAEVEWQRKLIEKGTYEETVVPYPGRTDLSVQVFCIASPERLPALHAMLETLRTTD